jgi:hypothetical protein
MGGSYWRDISLKVIQKVVAQVGTDDLKALKKALQLAYPFGQRQHYPYKCWLREQKRALAEAKGGWRALPKQRRPWEPAVVMIEEAPLFEVMS